MKKIELNLKESTIGGSWVDTALGIACVGGVFIVATGTSVFTLGASAFLGASGVMACLAGVAKNTYL